MANKNQNGFTLVEMAIVMVIIGLLIGGILKGQELIANAQVAATAAQIKSFESAFTTFIDVYGAKPGDFAKATSRITGCNATNRCVDGDGDGFIWHNNSLGSANGGVLTGQQGEMRQALKHLALSDLIGGVNGADDGSADGLVASKMSGYLYIGEVLGNGKVTSTYRPSADRSGIYVAQTADHRQSVRQGNGPRTNVAREIAKLDRKIDDGTPFTGTIVVAGSWAGCVDGQSYREQVEDKACSFAARIK